MSYKVTKFYQFNIAYILPYFAVYSLLWSSLNSYPEFGKAEFSLSQTLNFIWSLNNSGSNPDQEPREPHILSKLIYLNLKYIATFAESICIYKFNECIPENVLIS